MSIGFLSDVYRGGREKEENGGLEQGLSRGRERSGEGETVDGGRRGSKGEGRG